jgi:hypothetical protein
MEWLAWLRWRGGRLLLLLLLSRSSLKFDFLICACVEYRPLLLLNSSLLICVGRKMAEFPVDPMLAKMIIQSEKYGVSGGC